MVTHLPVSGSRASHRSKIPVYVIRFYTDLSQRIFENVENCRFVYLLIFTDLKLK